MIYFREESIYQRASHFSLTLLSIIIDDIHAEYYVLTSLNKFPYKIPNEYSTLMLCLLSGKCSLEAFDVIFN